jgi:hypothetical protein
MTVTGHQDWMPWSHVTNGRIQDVTIRLLIRRKQQLRLFYSRTVWNSSYLMLRLRLHSVVSLNSRPYTRVVIDFKFLYQVSSWGLDGLNLPVK